MKLLCICEPSHYHRPTLDIPIFYQSVACDQRVEFFHTCVVNVLTQKLNSEKIAVAPVTGNLNYDQFLNLNKQIKTEDYLQNFDLVFCRTLKPFPPGYLDKLRTWEQFTQFVNNPTGIQQQIHPTFLLKYADYTPPMIVTNNIKEAEDFFRHHQVIVAKQSNSCGGKGVFKIWQQGEVFKVDNLVAGAKHFSTFAQVINYIQNASSEQIQLMQYLQGVSAGDKRVVVVDGKIYGAYLRRSQSGYWVNNVSSDGECSLAQISNEELVAIQNTVSHYRNLGLFTLGYDFLLDDKGMWRISEINAGNIGGFARLELLTGKPILKQFISWLIDFAAASTVS